MWIGTPATSILALAVWGAVLAMTRELVAAGCPIREVNVGGGLGRGGLGLVNVLRADVPRASLDRAEVLAMAPAAEDQQFRVPRILGEAP